MNLTVMMTISELESTLWDKSKVLHQEDFRSHILSPAVGFLKLRTGLFTNGDTTLHCSNNKSIFCIIKFLFLESSWNGF